MFAAMKDLGIESDEDVGLGLDFEEDEDEFRKCIEDDVPGAPSCYNPLNCLLLSITPSPFFF